MQIDGELQGMDRSGYVEEYEGTVEDAIQSSRPEFKKVKQCSLLHLATPLISESSQEGRGEISRGNSTWLNSRFYTNPSTTENSSRFLHWK